MSLARGKVKLQAAKGDGDLNAHSLFSGLCVGDADNASPQMFITYVEMAFSGEESLHFAAGASKTPWNQLRSRMKVEQKGIPSRVWTGRGSGHDFRRY